MPYVCPWWGGYFIDNCIRRLFHPPEKIIKHYIQHGMTVLDYGCGMGLFSIPMAQLVGEKGCVIAVDLQQKMLDKLIKRAHKAGVAERIHVHCCQAHTIGWDEPVDFILAFYSAHESPDLQRLLTEIYLCLNHDSHFLLVEPVGHVSANAFSAMLSMAKEIGFKLSDQPQICLSHAADFVKV